MGELCFEKCVRNRTQYILILERMFDHRVKGLCYQDNIVSDLNETHLSRERVFSGNN